MITKKFEYKFDESNSTIDDRYCELTYEYEGYEVYLYMWIGSNCFNIYEVMIDGEESDSSHPILQTQTHQLMINLMKNITNSYTNCCGDVYGTKNIQLKRI